MPRKTSWLLAFALAIALLLGTASAQNCGDLDHDIVFAGLDWNSAQLHNSIVRFILEEGFGCATDDIPGSTVPMTQGLVRGDIDVNLEIWFNTAPEIYHEALADGSVIELGRNMNALEAWFVPRYVIEGDPERGIEALAPDLVSVFDLPEYAHLFTDPEQPELGRFYNCIIGWQCELINNEKLEAYGLSEHFTNFKPGTGAALAGAIEGAYRRGEPIVTYYWGPTWVLGDFDMVRLEEPAFSDECWQADKGCAYPTSVVNKAVTGEFAEQAPAEVLTFLSNYAVDQATISELLALMRANGDEAEAVALHFLRTRPDMWTDWLPEEVAARVQGAL